MCIDTICNCSQNEMHIKHAKYCIKVVYFISYVFVYSEQKESLHIICAVLTQNILILRK